MCLTMYMDKINHLWHYYIKHCTLMMICHYNDIDNNHDYQNIPGMQQLLIPILLLSHHYYKVK